MFLRTGPCTFCRTGSESIINVSTSQTTHCVPHHYVDVVREGAIDVLRGVQVEKVTVVVVEIDSCTGGTDSLNGTVSEGRDPISLTVKAHYQTLACLMCKLKLAAQYYHVHKETWLLILHNRIA